MAADDRRTRPNFDAVALLTIDVQRDVLDGGPLEVAGTTEVLPTITERRRRSAPPLHLKVA